MLSTAAHFGPNNSLLWGANLCITECLGASLSCRHPMSVASPQD